MNKLAIEKTELNKILSMTASYAVLDGAKRRLETTEPVCDLREAKNSLQITQECVSLLFIYGAPKVEYFPPFYDEIARAEKGATLTLAELLKVENLLRCARIVYNGIQTVSADEIVKIKEISERIYFDENLEEDIRTKILNDSEVSDFASDKLYALRREIRLLNERIRARLAEYLSGSDGKYLQDGIVTMRDNRYVLPVRAEYKRNIKGFIHDRSASGATFFIEPEEVLEMNNELRSLAIDEKEEVERILKELSMRVGNLGGELTADIDALEEIDCAFARAEFAYKNGCTMPELNADGIIEVEEGRHPLIERKKVVPVSFALGKDYRFLLISGPNTGGKTVTLKMVGLFCMMAMCGLFVPAKRAKLSVFDEIFCDLGDSQSIEESLSTFSSHVTNIIKIVESVTDKSLVLIDELGGGTDPDEGQALAKAIVAHLLQTGCTGVITTHYTALKEFAFSTNGIKNACMEFDSATLQPLYVIRIGVAGSSNALGISRRLSLKESILNDAMANLSSDVQKYENIVRSAEESRLKAEETLQESNRLKAEWQEKLLQLETEREKLQREKEKTYAGAKAESRRIIREKTADAEELIKEIEDIFAKQTLTESDLIKAHTLKNKLSDKAYESEMEEIHRPQYKKAESKDIQKGAKVYITTLNQEGIIQDVRLQKREVEVLCGNIRVRSKFSDLAVLILPQTAQTTKNPAYKKTETVQVKKSLTPRPAPMLEINVIGRTVIDAIPEIESFLDSAVLANLEEVRIVHGMGTGKLRAGIHEFLRTQKIVAEYRLGKYGEGDTGVTIVKLK